MNDEVIVSAGTPIYSVPLGIIMLDCKFPRIVGDVGNVKSFSFPVQYEILFDVNFQKLINEEDPDSIRVLVSAAAKLERMGVHAVTTSCGLLLKYQRLLSERLSIPVATSAVFMLPTLASILSTSQKVLIVCSDSNSLTSEDIVKHTLVPESRFNVHGLQDCPKFNNMFNVQDAGVTCLLDKEVIYKEIYDSCKKVINEANNTYKIVLLECTNLGVYSKRLKIDLGLPVFDFLSLAQLLYSGVI